MRKPFRFIGIYLGVLTLPLFSTLALADVPPEPGYVEKCTIEKQCKKNEEGDECRAWHGDRDVCTRKHEADGFQFKCRSRGASVWSEVFCRARDEKPKKEPKPEKKPEAPNKPAK